MVYVRTYQEAELKPSELSIIQSFLRSAAQSLTTFEQLLFDTPIAVFKLYASVINLGVVEIRPRYFSFKLILFSTYCRGIVTVAMERPFGFFNDVVSSRQKDSSSADWSENLALAQRLCLWVLEVRKVPEVECGLLYVEGFRSSTATVIH